MTQDQSHRPRLCAHADQDGEGMHVLQPGEVCADAVRRPVTQDQTTTEQDILDGERHAEVSRLQAENERLRGKVAAHRAEIDEHVRVRTEIGDILDKALGGHEDGTESGAKWIVRDVGLLARELAHARRELVAVREQHSASVQVLAAHLEAVRAGELRCDHPEHAALPAVETATLFEPPMRGSR